MSRPLFFTSSKPASTPPPLGQIQAISSSALPAAAAAGADADAAAGAGADADGVDGAEAAAAGRAALAAPAGTTGGTGAGDALEDVTGLATAPAAVAEGEADAVAAAAAVAVAVAGAVATTVPATGGAIRSTWPTSIWLGFSTPLQRTISRQFCPVSRPMRIMVSPGLTV